MRYAILSLLFLSGSLARAADPAPLKVFVGGDYPELNGPYLSVKICAPGTDRCTVIDKVSLDTGSAGLRIFRRAVAGLKLPGQPAGAGALAECQLFGGGGDGYWGPVAKADLVLGGQTATGVPVQLLDDQYGAVPADCGKARPFPTAQENNGIFGINPAAVDAGGSSYYSCDAKGCTALAITPGQRVANPIRFLPSDTNGFRIHFPSVPPAGLAQLEGEIQFGLGTKPGNALPTDATVIHTSATGQFYVGYDGASFLTSIDCGTPYYSLPKSHTKIPVCANGWQLCPHGAVSLDTELQNFDQSPAAPFVVKLTAAGTVNANSRVIPATGMVWGGEMENWFMIGLPFFYGKTIYFAIDGQPNPLGQAAFAAFKEDGPVVR